MNLESLTIGEARELSRMFGCGGGSHSLLIGKIYLVETVTKYFSGRLVFVTDTDMVLDDAAWIADTGRFAQAMLTGDFNEVEPYPGSVIVSRASVVCVSEISKANRSQK